MKPKAEQLLAMKVLAARSEPAKDFIDVYIPMSILGERQMNFIKYLGEDLGYDWK